MEKRNNNKRLNGAVRKVVMLSIVAILMSLRGIAQTDTEFWFAAPEMDSTHADSSIIRFASINAVDVTVSIPANLSFTPITFHLAANTDTLIDWNKIGAGKVNYKNSIENTALDVAAFKGIHIVATDKIEAYYEVKSLPNSEVFALKGANALGRLFYISMQNYWYNKYPMLSNGNGKNEFGTSKTNPVGQDSLPLPWALNDFQDAVAEDSWSAFDIVATENGTSIDITPTNPIISKTTLLDRYGFIVAGSEGTLHPAGVKYNITLEAGETYSARQAYKNPTKSLGGTKVQVINATGHKIAITSKEDGLIAWNHDNSGVYLNPTDNSTTNLYDWSNYAFDAIGDQLIPVELIGNEYVVMRGGIYPDQDLNANAVQNDWDYDGERVFMTATVDSTVITVKSYRNDGTLLNTYTSQSLKAGQVFSYNFKYSSNKNDIEQFLSITSNGTAFPFYTYHVSGQLSELGSGIIPTITGCTGSTQLAFTRSYNGLFQVNLMVKQGAEGAFKVFDSKGLDVSSTFNIIASNFKTIPGTGWSVYTQPNNIWGDPATGINKAVIDQTYIIKNTLNVFHLGILNISEFNIIDTTRVPTFANWLGDSKPNAPKLFRGYNVDTGTVPTSVIETIWKKPGWTITKLTGQPADRIGFSITNADTTLFVAFYKNNSRGAFYGYFSDFNKFMPFAAVPDANHPKCLGDTIQLTASGGVTYTWSQPANLKFIDPATAQNPRVVPQVTGTYNLNVHIVGFCSKDTTYTFVFKVVSKPVPTITGSTSVCFGTGNNTYTVALADTNGFGTAIKTWTVVGGTIVSGQGSKSIVVDWTSVGAQSVSVTIDNGSCGIGSTTLPVTISPNATVTVPSPITVCNNDIVPVTAFVSNPTGAAFGWVNSNTAIGLGANGTGQIAAFTAKNTTALPITSTITVTPTLGCPGTPSIYTITVNPTPTVTVPSGIAVCNNAMVSTSAFLTTPTGGTFTWTNSNTDIGLGANGTGQTPSFIATNTGTSPITGTIAVTPLVNGCTGSANSYVITVNPTPSVTLPANVVVCNGNLVQNSGFTGTPTGVTYSWTNSNNAIGLATSGTGQIPSFTGTNTSTDPITGTITVTPSANTCLGSAKTYTISVDPTPKVTVPSNTTVCTGTAIVAYTPTSATAGVSFTWTNNQPSIGLPASGTGIIPAFTATNTGTSAITATITITPMANGCSGTANSYTIKVNPKDNAGFSYSPNTFCQTGTNPSPTITGLTGGTFSSTSGLTINPSTGLITLGTSTLGTYNVLYTTNGTCPNSASVSVTITNAPSAAFAYAGPYCKDEINPNPIFNSGASAGVFTASPNIAPNVLVFVNAATGQVNLAASAPGTYTVTNTITASGGCAAATANATIVIKPMPTVTVPANFAVCNNTSVATTAFTSNPAGATFTWTNSNTAIGLVANGTGQVPTFTATNTTMTAINGTISVIPILNGCSGTPGSYVITVNPTATVAVPSNILVCNNEIIPITTFASNPAGGTFAWTNSNPAIGLTANGTGQIASFTAKNNTAANISGTITVTPTVNTCLGASNTYTITVKPSPSVTVPANGTYCNGSTVPVTSFESIPTGGTFTWTNSNTAIGLGGSGSGQIAPFTATNTSSAAIIGTISVTPTTGGCAGTASSYTITVNPTPTVAVPSNISVCVYGTVPTTAFVSTPAGGTFNWVNTNASIGLATSGSGQISSFMATNTTTAPITATITVTPTVNTCLGTANSYTITVNPAPKVNDQSVKVCELTAKNITVKSTGGAKPLQTGIWTIISGSSVTYGAADSVLTVTAKAGTGSSQFRYVLPDKNGCSDTAIVTVANSLNPTVTLTPATVCQNASLTFVPTINGTNNPKPVWSSLPANPALIPANQLTNTTVNAVTSNSGNYTVQVIVTDSIGCVGTTGTVAVTINPNPTVTINPATDVHICQNAPLTINAQSNPTTVSYKWSGDVASLSSTTLASTTFTSSVPGSHAYSLSVSTANSCSTVVPYNVIVDANPIFTLGPDISLCSGISTKITINPTAGVGPYIYDWSDENGPFNLPHDNAPTYVKKIPGTYTINLTVTDSSTSCKSSDAMIVTVNANPTVAPAGQGCAGTLITVAGNPTGGSGTYSKHEWSGTDVALLIANQTTVNPTLQTTIPGPHYLHYKVTDSKGCIGEKDGTVTVYDLPKSVITGKPQIEVCAKVTLPITVTNPGTGTYKWTGTGATYLSSTTAQNPTFTSSVAGTYSLTVTTTDGNTCAGIDVISVKVNPLPTPVVLKDSLCAGDTKQLKGDANFSNHKWSGDVSLIPVAQLTSQNPTFATLTTTTAKTYNLIYTVIDAKGCTDSIPVSVKVNPLPAANAGADIEYSYGDVLTLNGLPGTSAQYLYTWTPKDSINGSNTTQNVTTVALHSTFSFNLLVQNKITQCKANDDVKVIDTTGTLIVKIEATPSEICVGDTSHLSINVKGGKRPYTYAWSPAFEQKYADGDIRVRPTITTAYSLTVKDINNITEYAYVTVTVNQLPTITLANKEVCSNDTLQLTPTIVTQVGSTITNVLWTGSGTSGLHGVTTVANVDFYNNISGNYPLNLAVTDSKGCKSSGSMSVTINELPVIAILGDKPEICAGSTVALSVNQTKGAALTSYAWTDVPSGHLSSAVGSTNTYSSTVSGDVYLSVIDAKGCKASSNYHVNVNENPTPQIADASICQDATLTLDGKPSGGTGTYTTHLWTGTDVAKLTPTNTQTAAFNTSISGTYSVNYAVTDSKTCTGNKTIQVVVNALPSATYSPLPLEVCAGSSFTITASATPLASIVTYKWIEPGKPLQGNNTSIVFKSDSVGVKKIYYQVITDKNCSLLDPVLVTVKPKPTITINPDKLAVCENELDNLGSTYAGGTNTPLSFTWSTTPSSPDLLTSFDKQTTIFKKAVMGTAIVQLIYVDQNSCSDTDKVSIQVNPNPVVNLVQKNYHACQNQDLPLEANPTKLGNRTYTWIGGTGLAFLSSTTVSNPVFNSSTVGTYTLKYKISETSFGCETYDSISINVTASPIKMTETERKCQGDPLQLNVSGMSATSYIWSGTNTSLLSSTSIANPTISTLNAGIYNFTVTGTIGTVPNACSEIATVKATVIANPTITGIPVSDSAYYQEKYKYTPIVTPVSGVTYAWTPVATFYDAAINDAVTKPVIDDITNISLLVTETMSGLGCKTSVNTKLFVRDTIKPKITTTPVCLGDSVELKGSAIGGDANKKYTWEIDGVKYYGSELKFLPSDTTVVKLFVNDLHDTVTTSSTVIVYPKPEVTQIRDSTCAGDVVNIALPGGATKYIWQGVGTQNLTSTTTQTTQFVTNRKDATQLYKLYVQTWNAYGCYDSSTVDIKVNENPKIFVNDTIQVVTGKSTTITAGTSTKYTYEWTPANLLVDPTLGTVTTVNLTGDTKFTVKVIDKITGCWHDTIIIVKVDPPITVTINSASTCKGGSVSILATVKNSKKPIPTFVWTNQSGVVLQQGPSYSLTYTPTATTTITVSVTDSYSSDVDTKTVTVYPLPSVSISPDLGTYVIGQQVRELSAVVASGTGTSPYVYSWSASSNLVNIDQSLPDPAKILFSSEVEGIYDVNVLVIDANNCRNTAIISPSVIKPPVWPKEFCQGNSFEFEINSPRDLKWVVVNNGKTTEFIGTKNIVKMDSIGGSITLYDLNDLTTPIYSYSFKINNTPYVNFEYTPTTQISISDNVNFVNLSVLDQNRQLIPNNLVFFWDFVGDQVYTSEEVNPVYSYDEMGNYQISLIGLDTVTRCRDTITKKLEVTPNPICGLKFPNAFTPEDLKDNHFLPGYIVGIKDSGYDLKIYNRWGQLLFETTSKTGSWDGVYNNAVCKQDVYVYHCKAVCENGKEFFINGDVTLIK